MGSTSLCLSSLPSTILLLPSHGRRTTTKTYAMKRDDEFSRRRTSGGPGGRVDESMIVLRKRIHEMNMIERNYEPPNHWMEWEKKYYTVYDSMVYQIVGVLQSQLMNMRPSSALGFAAFLTFSSFYMPSTVMLFLHAFAAANGIFSGLHLN